MTMILLHTLLSMTRAVAACLSGGRSYGVPVCILARKDWARHIPICISHMACEPRAKDGEVHQRGDCRATHPSITRDRKEDWHRLHHYMANECCQGL